MRTMIAAGRSLVLDNYDSFTWNLVHLMRCCGDDPIVLRHDDPLLDSDFRPSRLLVSPGPGRPEAAGRTMEILSRAMGQIPILGVCLGHQALGLLSGMTLERAPKATHGKVSSIHHHGEGLFQGVRQPFRAMRYHSLTLTQVAQNADFQVSAEAQELGQTLIMGIAHKALPIAGIQFHPESFLTEDGRRMMENFLSW